MLAVKARLNQPGLSVACLQEVVVLQPGETKRLLQPLPSPPPGPLTSGTALGGAKAGEGGKGSSGGAASPALPPLRLLLDVLGVQLPAGLALPHPSSPHTEPSPWAAAAGATGAAAPGFRLGSGPEGQAAGPVELACRIKITGRASPLLAESGWGMVTRALPCTASPLFPSPTAAAAPGSGANSSGGLVSWCERFVLQLPPALSEQLLLPAPGDNPFAGEPLELQLEVLAPVAAGGTGSVVARGAVPIQFDWLANQAAFLQLAACASGRHGADGGGAAAAAAAAAAGMLAGEAAAGASARDRITAAALQVQVPLAPASPGAAAADRTSAGDPSAVPGKPLLHMRVSLDSHQAEWLSSRLASSSTSSTAAGGTGSTAGGRRGGPKPLAGRESSVGKRALKLPPSEAWAPFALSGGAQAAPTGKQVAWGATGLAKVDVFCMLVLA